MLIGIVGAIVAILIAAAIIMRRQAAADADPIAMRGEQVLGAPAEVPAGFAGAMFPESAASEHEAWVDKVRAELDAAFDSGELHERMDLGALKLDAVDASVAGFVKQSIAKIRNVSLYQDILGDLGSGMDDMSRMPALIQKDPYLSLKLLSFANSTYFSPVTKIESVASALIYLGQRHLKAFMLRELVDTLAGGEVVPKKFLAGIWSHAAAAAACSSRLAGAFPRVDFRLLYTTSLVHDIGRVLLYHFGGVSPELKLSCLSFDDDESLERENIIFGTNHAAVGMLVAREFELPEVISETIRLHHCPTLISLESLGLDERLGDCVLAVHLADRLAKLYVEGGAEQRPSGVIDFSYHRLVPRQKLFELAGDRATFKELQKLRLHSGDE